MTLPRIYPILDTQTCVSRGCDPETAAQAWIEGGARILQFRHKGQWSRPVYEQAGRIVDACRRRGVAFVVNDRADMARLLGAGVHVGQDDLPPSDARRIAGPDAFIGVSTHNPIQLDAAADEPVDYVAIGPIFTTASKDRPDPVVALEGLAGCRARCLRPLVAIGGITRKTARAVYAAGADSVAVIGDFFPEECTSANLRLRMEEWQQLARM